MRHLFSFVIIFFLFSSECFTSDDDYVEIFVYNESGTDIYARFYPITAIFQGKSISHPTNPPFTLLSRGSIPRAFGGPVLGYCVGLDGYALANRGPDEYYKILPEGVLLLDHNSSGSN